MKYILLLWKFMLHTKKLHKKIISTRKMFDLCFSLTWDNTEGEITELWQLLKLMHHHPSQVSPHRQSWLEQTMHFALPCTVEAQFMKFFTLQNPFWNQYHKMRFYCTYVINEDVIYRNILTNYYLLQLNSSWSVGLTSYKPSSKNMYNFICRSYLSCLYFLLFIFTEII